MYIHVNHGAFKERNNTRIRYMLAAADKIKGARRVTAPTIPKSEAHSISDDLVNLIMMQQVQTGFSGVLSSQETMRTILTTFPNNITGSITQLRQDNAGNLQAILASNERNLAAQRAAQQSSEAEQRASNEKNLAEQRASNEKVISKSHHPCQ